MIERLEVELYGAIANIRAIARASAFNYAATHFPGVSPGGMSERLEDIRRAKLYAGNAGNLGRDVLREGGPVIKRLDNRLITIGITENSEAYNSEHRRAVLDVADRLDLIEVWDATLDSRTCEHCAGLDGTEAVDGEFPGGLVPGHVHGRCRCTSHFIRRRILN